MTSVCSGTRESFPHSWVPARCVSNIADWLRKSRFTDGHAKAQSCEQFAVDSGVQRSGAHRFYFTKRMEIIAYHFSLKLNNQPKDNFPDEENHKDGKRACAG